MVDCMIQVGGHLNSFYLCKIDFSRLISGIRTRKMKVLFIHSDVPVITFTFELVVLVHKSAFPGICPVLILYRLRSCL